MNERQKREVKVVVVERKEMMEMEVKVVELIVHLFLQVRAVVRKEEMEVY